MLSYHQIGCLFGATGVIMGAFGSHLLQHSIKDPKLLQTWQIATHYQFIHALALLYAQKRPYSSLCFTVGNLFFSGSLYALVLLSGSQSGLKKVLGPVTPIGGLFYIAGWLFLFNNQ